MLLGSAVFNVLLQSCVAAADASSLLGAGPAARTQSSLIGMLLPASRPSSQHDNGALESDSSAAGSSLRLVVSGGLTADGPSTELWVLDPSKTFH